MTISSEQTFLDTNVLVYAFTNDEKALVAQELLDRGCLISVQVLNEFINVGMRKLAMSWAEMQSALKDIRLVCPSVLGLDLETHEDALRLIDRHRFSIFDAIIVATALRAECQILIFDAIIVATALRAECQILYSEDMQDGMILDRRLEIINPFRI
ncbi:MAG: PIN domain-containing protein [Alphaproteobacteria bacterium GM202ARS2]|nr:PIN domain-containing protein [Alphaproteobacteria bacterium GM202ARS2]